MVHTDLTRSHTLQRPVVDVRLFWILPRVHVPSHYQHIAAVVLQLSETLKAAAGTDVDILRILRYNFLAFMALMFEPYFVRNLTLSASPFLVALWRSESVHSPTFCIKLICNCCHARS